MTEKLKRLKSFKSKLRKLKSRKKEKNIGLRNLSRSVRLFKKFTRK